MNPILLQKQLRDNAADLQDFCKDLKHWGQEMKRKEDSLKAPDNMSKNDNQKNDLNQRKKVKKVRITEDSSTKQKAACTDYKAWEKFDVETECAKIDDADYEESDLTDEFDETKRDEAMLHKEKGNKYVKNQKWSEAIECYTKAINCYRYDPIYFANRALCYLKLKKMIDAEEDCNLSLKLDPSYVKAYQRRAAAREALNNLDGAKYDLEQVLKFEPNNKESKAAMGKLNKFIEEAEKAESQRPVSKFTASRSQNKIPNVMQKSHFQLPTMSAPSEGQKSQLRKLSQTVDDSKNISNWPSGDDGITLVNPIKKPPHLQSKKPLKRIPIVDCDSSVKNKGDEKVNKKQQKSVTFKEDVIEHEIPNIPIKEDQPEKFTIRTDDMKVIERNYEDYLKTDDTNVVERKNEDLNKILAPEIDKEIKNSSNGLKKLNMINETINLKTPKTSVQFYTSWKLLKDTNLKYQYLSKYIEPYMLPDIFKESLDSDVFSEIIKTMADHFIPSKDQVYPFLDQLTKVKRFSALTMFMTSNDKNNLWKLIDYMRDQENKLKEEVDELVKKYEL